MCEARKSADPLAWVLPRVAGEETEKPIQAEGVATGCSKSGETARDPRTCTPSPSRGAGCTRPRIPGGTRTEIGPPLPSPPTFTQAHHCFAYLFRNRLPRQPCRSPPRFWRSTPTFLSPLSRHARLRRLSEQRVGNRDVMHGHGCSTGPRGCLRATTRDGDGRSPVLGSDRAMKTMVATRRQNSPRPQCTLEALARRERRQRHRPTATRKPPQL